MTMIVRQLAYCYQRQKNNSSPYCQRTKTIKEELESAYQMNTNSSIEKQQKSRKVDGGRTCYCSHPHLLDQMVQRKARCKGEVLLNGPKNHESSLIVLSDKKVQMWERKADFSTVDTILLFFLLGSHRSNTLVCNPSAQYCFVSTSLNMFTNFIYEIKLKI